MIKLILVTEFYLYQYDVIFLLFYFSIKKAVSLINGIDPGKFPLLLSRILQKLHIKVVYVMAGMW